MPGSRSDPTGAAPGSVAAGEQGGLARVLYSLAWMAGIPLVIGYLLWRSLRQPAYRQHWGERFALGGPAAPMSGQTRMSPDRPGPIWLHAVSVGETAAAVPLLRRLAVLYPDADFLLTHGTPTGRATGRERLRDLGDRFTQCYLPYDLPGATGRFFRTYRPRVGLIMETEVWPNLMVAARRQQVPVASINARLSAKSLAQGLRHRRLIVPTVAAFDRIIAQSESDSLRMRRLGRLADAVVGNLKFDQPVSFNAQKKGLAWRRRFGARPVVLAASTREGEEVLLLEAWQAEGARETRPLGDAFGAITATPGIADGLEPLLIIVPRHPNRFDAVARLIQEQVPEGRFARRDALDDDQVDLARCSVLLGDSMGEMQSWYAAADVAIMGGSLLPFGSQNLIEANALGCPVVLGPSTFNFEQAAIESTTRGASQPVVDASEAVSVALSIATDAGRREAMAEAALAFAEAHRGATERTLKVLTPMLTAALGPPQVPR